MRKIYFLLFTFFSFLTLRQNVSAQLANTYIYLSSTGATLDPMAGATNILGTGDDDNVSTLQNIGFTFVYEGANYTQFTASPDGFIKLGSAVGANQFGNAITSTTNVPKLFPYWDDLATGTSGYVKYVLNGTGTNHILVIEWFITNPRATGGAANSTMQAWLYEAGGRIEFRYGAGVGPSSSASIGIGGLTATNFISITTPGNASSTTTANDANTVWPGSGTMYTFFPPPPCVPGSLAGGTTSGPGGTVCPGLSFTLSVSGASFGTGLTYQWETSPNNATWTDAPGASTGQTYTTSVTTSNYFRRKMVCNGQTANAVWSTSLLISVSAPIPLSVSEGFNTSGTTVFPGCWSQQIVSGTGAITFQTNSGQPTTVPFEGTRFAFWNSFSIANTSETRLVSPAIITTGTSSVDVQFYWYNEFNATYSAGQYLLEGVQVQYSLDGVTWVDAGAFIPRHDPSLAPATGQWKQKKVTLPAAAGNQPTIFVGFKFHSGFGDNCSLDAANIIPTPTCTEPSVVTISNLTTSGATISWTASPSNPSNGYQWEVRTSGAAGSGPAGLVASGTTAAGVTTANAAGLTANTAYTAYVRSDCGGGTFSFWTAPTIFSTPCGIVAVPFSENFATYATTFPPSCWTRNNTTYLIGLAPSAYGVGAGSAKFDFYGASTGTQLDLTSPDFTPLPGGYFLIFDHAYATFTTEVDQLQILYSTNGGASYSTLATYLGGTNGPLNTAGGAFLGVFSPSASQWATKAIALPVGTNKLLFRGISAFGNNLFLDNIALTNCVAPTGLGLSAIAQTTATLSWTASTSNPSNGYQWEVRTSGAGGSGATGLVASGTTAAGVTSANVTGLSAYTAYTYYVRSDCGGSFSFWAGPYSFTTPCNPIGIPFTETFATYATTFPPTCWLRNDATNLTGQSPSAYGVGLGSAEFDFYDASAGTALDLTSPIFTPTPAGWGLVFDHAYATFAGENDQLQVFYSTNGGATYTSLIVYDGGTSGPLNTGGAVLPAFSPTAGQWANKAILLPTGTNRLMFRGISAFGNNLFLDNIALVSCLPATNVKAQGISPTMIKVTYSNPSGGSVIAEWGPAGYTPGTGASAGAAAIGSIHPSASPFFISTGLNPSTTYDVYVRRECTVGVDYSSNVKATTSTLCPATNIPYLQTFESATVPGMPTCTSVQDVNGNSGSFWLGTGGGAWETYTDANPLTYVSPSKALLYYYDFNNLARGGDDWFYIQGLNLTAGTNYRLKFFYKAIDGVNFPEKMEVKYGTLADNSVMSNSLFVNNNISSIYDNPYDSVRVDFTPPSTGVYYIGFHAMSDGDEFGLLVDDISVKLAPLVDVGISAVTLPSLNCPTNNVFVQATVTNFNTTTQNFATYPVTVTGTIVGPTGTSTLTALLNTGTLAPGASMGIYLSPTYSFSQGGTYTVTVATSTTPASNDPETGNDSYTTSITVNANPATPVITPANPAICLGNPVQLSTQFTASPPPVVMPPVSSGTINLAIPDATAAGVNHTLAVSGVPLGASITGISVTINATHTWNSDLIFNLQAPNGKRLNLINAEGGSGDGFTNCIISSASNNPLPAGNTTPITGTFKPDAALAVGPTAFTSDVTTFIPGLSSQPNGNWTIAVNDNAGFDVGTLLNWSITITYQVLSPTITWTPTAGLYTNAGATTPYTGGNAFSLYANPPATTTYTVTATSPQGCTSSASTTVTVSPYPVVAIGSIPDSVCTSDPLIPLVATPVGGSWSGIGVSGMNFVPPATAVGTYTLTYTYTSPAGCTTTATKKIAVKDCPERIILLRDNALLLYPNPNTGLFNIKVNSVLYNNLVMKVYANNGTLVRTQQIGGLAWGRVVPIDLTNLPGGVYMVKFYYDGGVRTSEKTFKVIIGHQ